MKTASALVVLAVVLAVLGAGASYTGYNESLQTLTMTSTQSLTATSTETITSTSTESYAVTTAGVDWLLQGEIISLQATSPAYCGWYDYRHLTLDPGNVHVSFRTDGRAVEYWVLTQADYDRMTREGTCRAFTETKGLVRGTSNGEEFTVAIPSSGEYYFLFSNTSTYNAVTVTLDVDLGMQQHVSTVTSEHIIYSTMQTEFPTQTITSSTRPAGFGLLFYSGIGLVLVSAVILAVSRRRVTAPSPTRVASATPVVPVAPVVSPRPAPPSSLKPSKKPSADKFCMNCGAPLSARARFCNKCGERQ